MFLFRQFAHFARVENIDGFIGVLDGLLILLHHGVNRAQVFISGRYVIFNLADILLFDTLGIVSEDAPFDVKGHVKLLGSLAVVSLKFMVHADVIAGASQTPQGTLVVDNFAKMRLVFGPMSFHICKQGF